MRIPRCALAALIGFALASCSQGRVNTEQGYTGGPLPRPTQVVVYDFTLAPEQVQLDQAIGARLQRAVGGESAEQRESEATAAAEVRRHSLAPSSPVRPSRTRAQEQAAPLRRDRASAW